MHDTQMVHERLASAMASMPSLAVEQIGFEAEVRDATRFGDEFRRVEATGAVVVTIKYRPRST